MNMRGIDISSGNVEDILAVLDILVADLSNVKDEIKELKSFESQKLQSSVKKMEEIEEEIFNLLSSATQLYNKIQELNENIDIKKSNFEEEVTSLIENTLKEVKNELVHIKTELKDTLKEVINAPDEVTKSYSKLIENFEYTINNVGRELIKTINNIENDLKSSVTKVENASKSAIKSIEEYLEKTKAEIDQKTFFQRWGAVIGAFAFGVAISFAFLLVVPTINKTQPKITATNPKATYKTEYFCTNKTPIDLNLAYFVFNKGKLIPVYNLDSWNGVGILFKANETKKMMGFIKYKDKIFYEVEKGKYLLPTKDTLYCYSKKIEIK